MAVVNGTLANILRFCEVILRRNSRECLGLLQNQDNSESIGILYNFFDWCLNQKVSKHGRKKRGTKTKSALSTYWKTFRLFFEEETGDKLQNQLNRKMHRV
jgi:hypothetical protein